MDFPTPCFRRVCAVDSFPCSISFTSTVRSERGEREAQTRLVSWVAAAGCLHLDRLTMLPRAEQLVQKLRSQEPDTKLEVRASTAPCLK